MMSEQPHPPIEYRRAAVTGVDFEMRIAEMVLVPWEEEAIVEYRGELWEESFLRGAFNGIENRPELTQVRANRDHDASRTVGKAVRHWPSREEGLVSEIRIAPTPLGEETLTLLSEDMLSASVGFAVKGSDQILNRPKRIIKRAFLDHIAFVAQPAYAGARVLAVRDGEERPNAVDLSPLVTPNLDEVQAWLTARS